VPALGANGFLKCAENVAGLTRVLFIKKLLD
jgi:hypothetical protein